MDLATLIHAMDLSDPVDRLALADLMADLGRTEEESLLRDMDFVIVWDDEAIGFRIDVPIIFGYLDAASQQNRNTLTIGSRKRAVKDCLKFRRDNTDLLDGCDVSDAQIGRYFYLCREERVRKTLRLGYGYMNVKDGACRDDEGRPIPDDESHDFNMEFYRRVCREPAIRQVTDPDGVVTLVEVTEGG